MKKPWIIVLFLFLSPSFVFAEEIFSPTLAKQECRKISDREERSQCYQQIEVRLQKEKYQEAFEEEKNEEGNLDTEGCKNIDNFRLRTACYAEVQRKEKEEKLEKVKENLEKEEEELFLRIASCENIVDFRERMLCYSKFHQEQEQKTQKEKDTSGEKEEKKQETILQNSPTLRLLECKKIRNREERSQCYKDLKWEETEQKIDEQMEEEENFDPIAEEKACLSLRDDSAREKCLRRLDQKEARIQRLQEEEDS